MIAISRRKATPNRTVSVSTGDLALRTIRFSDGRAVVTGTVGDKEFSATLTAMALQSWPTFQAELFTVAGLWARSRWVEECRAQARGQEWAGLIDAAIRAGQREATE
jgi:hypothetical protein